MGVKTNTRALERNITITYATRALAWCRFAIPVLALFYIASKVTLSEFSIIFSVFAFIILLLNVPAGVIADKIGKKNALLIASSAYVVEIFILSFANGFWPLLLGKIFSGVGVAFASGADQGILYDTLKKLKRTKEHKRISGIAFMIENIAMSIAFIIGAYLFSLNTKLPAIASIPFLIAALISTCFYVEPYPPKKTTGGIREHWQQLTASAKYAWRHPRVRYIILYTFIVLTALNILFTVVSVYLAAVSIPVIGLGIVSCLGTLMTAYAAKKAVNVERRFGERRTLLLTQIVTFGSILLCALLIPYYGVVFYITLSAAWGLYAIVANDYINHDVPQKYRTTILSICAMTGALGITLMLPLFGMVSERVSLGAALASLAVTGIVLSIGLALATGQNTLTRA
jgi:MFS family permease